MNGGLSWSPLVSSAKGAGLLPGAGILVALVADQQNAGTLYALTANGLFRSVDGGATWNVYFRPRAATVFSLVMDPLNSGTIYAGRYKSTDAGMTWAPMGTSSALQSGNVALAIDPQLPWNLYGGPATDDCPGSTVPGITEVERGRTSAPKRDAFRPWRLILSARGQSTRPPTAESSKARMRGNLERHELGAEPRSE